MDTPQAAKWFHRAGANTAENWQQTAQLLLAGASAIENDADRFHGETNMAGVTAVQAMLLGFAIECLLKGKWIADGHELTDANGEFRNVPNAGKHHDLVQLADAVKFKMSVSERGSVARLSPFVQWAGRYPIPLNWQQMLSTNVPGRGKVSPRFISRSDLKTADKVAWRLAKEVPIRPSLDGRTDA